MTNTSRVVCSSRRNPCPVCGRTKDGDCRFLDGGLILCHGNTEHRAGSVIDGQDGRYAFLGVTADGRCGEFRLDVPMTPQLSSVRPRPNPQAVNGCWQYSPTQRVIRQDTAKGKRFLPQHLVGATWQAGQGDGPWPLYGQVAATCLEAEGEKCIDICLSVGIPAITQPGHNHTNECHSGPLPTLKQQGIVQHLIYIADQ